MPPLARSMTLNNLYEHDIHAWTQQTAEFLRQ